MKKRRSDGLIVVQHQESGPQPAPDPDDVIRLVIDVVGLNRRNLDHLVVDYELESRGAIRYQLASTSELKRCVIDVDVDVAMVEFAASFQRLE